MGQSRVTPGEKSSSRLTVILLLLAFANCCFQIAWFWRFYAHDITSDAISYIGLTRHLLDGSFLGSVHGYWSPLITWLLAAGAFLTHDFVLLGRAITIASFLLCLPLLYVLTLKLWRSHTAAALSVLWFTLGRGVIARMVSTIQADFLLTACVLAYCIVLLACLRKEKQWNWLLLGAFHSAAFFAKAIALPWLSLTTGLAILATSQKNKSRPAATALLLAFLFPALTWLAWGGIMKAKYGVFNTGYQLRANLAVGLFREASNLPEGDSQTFADAHYDNYLVAQRPWADLQRFKVLNPALIPVILHNELRNFPAAIKEMAILLTPGGMLAFMVGLILLARRRAQYSAEAAFAWIAVAGFLVLSAAYGMLVFDARYVLPSVPVLIAIASRFVLPSRVEPADGPSAPPRLQQLSLALLVASTLFFTVYWASPFRTMTRDFQVSCRQAADLLKSVSPASGNIVSAGEGPFPEHGAGFEVGAYTAYLSGRHLVAMNTALPGPEQAKQLADAILSKNADAALLWGRPSNRTYQSVLAELRGSSRTTSDQAITDPVAGEVGRVVFLAQH